MNQIGNEINVKDVTYLYIAADVTEIPKMTKYSSDRPKVKTIQFLGNSIQTIASYAFYVFVNLSGPLNLSNQTSLTTIGSYAFGYTQLTSVQLPNSVNNIDNDAFSGCSTLESIAVGNGNTTYYSKDGVLFKKGAGNDKEILYRYPEGKTGNDYIIPDGVKTINDYAFKNVNHLQNVTIPATVTDIKESAFQTSKVEKVLFKDNSQLKNIEDLAFLSSSLSEIDLPEGLKKIGRSSFNITQLKTINIPESVTNIGNYAFYDCPNMTAINVAENNQNYQSIDGVLYTKDGNKLISYPTAKSINTYKVKDGVNTIGHDAFAYNENTPYVIVPDSVNQIDDFAFSDTQIKAILFEGALPTFWTNVFLDANADLKLYTFNSNDVGMNTSIGKEILLYKAPTLTIENNCEGKPEDTYQIEPTLNDDATFKNDMSYIYESSNSAIASVSPAGVITMHKAGTVDIKVTAADPFQPSAATMTVNVKEAVIDEGNQETPPTDPDSGETPNQSGTNNNTPNQPESNVTPSQPETKPQENPKEPESSNQVKTSDETMIIGMIGILLLGGMGILTLKKKEN